MKRDGKSAPTIGYFGAFVSLGMASAALGPTLPALAENTQTQLSEVSYLFTAHALGYLLGSFQGGRFYDRLPGHVIIISALVLLSAMLALTPLISTIWLLAVVMLCMGMAGGAIDVGGNTLLVWVHTRQVGPYMNGLHFFFGVGSFASPLIIALVDLATANLLGAYWILALLMVPAAAWLLWLPSPAPLPDAQPQQKAGAYANATSHFLQKDSVTISLIALLLFLYVGAEASFGGWIFTYAVESDLAYSASAAYLTSAYWGALTVGRLLAIPIAFRVRPRWILFGDLGGCIASLALILLWPGSLAALWIGSLGVGFFMASIFPTAVSLAERRLRITGRVTGWFLVGSSLGAMFLPWLIGQLFEARGPWITMASVLVAIVSALGVVVLLTTGAGSVDTTPKAVV
jgi:FHS family Na+ dependent glucose MFS transporter 1